MPVERPGLNLALIETRLSALSDELRREIETERQDVREMAESQDDEIISQHSADVGSDLFMEERALSTQRALERELRNVEAALQRIADGSYGDCVDCRQPIAVERLEARPQAIRCIECERRFESAAGSRGGGPAS